MENEGLSSRTSIKLSDAPRVLGGEYRALHLGAGDQPTTPTGSDPGDQ